MKQRDLVDQRNEDVAEKENMAVSFVWQGSLTRGGIILLCVFLEPISIDTLLWWTHGWKCKIIPPSWTSWSPAPFTTYSQIVITKLLPGISMIIHPPAGSTDRFFVHPVFLWSWCDSTSTFDTFSYHRFNLNLMFKELDVHFGKNLLPAHAIRILSFSLTRVRPRKCYSSSMNCKFHLIYYK